MHHFRRHEVESARSDLSAFAVASKGGRALDHGVRFIGGVPMLANMDRFWRANEQVGRLRFWIDMQDANLRGTFAKIGKNFVPFEFGQLLEDRLVRSCLAWNAGNRRARFRRASAQDNTS